MVSNVKFAVIRAPDPIVGKAFLITFKIYSLFLVVINLTLIDHLDMDLFEFVLFKIHLTS